MEHLSGQDAAFLAFEGPSNPMHVGGVAVFEGADGADPSAERVADEVAKRLGAIPRFRERLERGRSPRWVADPSADPTGHVEVTRVDAASGSPALRERLDELFTRPMDLTRSPWDVHVLSGLDGGRRLVVLFRVHHCMIDGTAGLGVIGQLFDPGAGSAPREAAAPPAHRPASAWRSLRALLALAGKLLRPGHASSLNGPTAPWRRIERVTLDEAKLRELGRAAGGTTNDALLAVVSGGVRRWLDEARASSAPLRAFCPVDVRRAGEASGFGNRLGAWLVDLPIDVADDEARVRAAIEATRRTRSGGHAAGVDWLGKLSDYLPGFVPRLAMALAGMLRTFGLVVTSVRGPSQPIRFLGAHLESFTALAPVFSGQRCSIASFRYAGKVHLGITGAWPDPEEATRLAAAIRAAFEASADPEERDERGEPWRRAG